MLISTALLLAALPVPVVVRTSVTALATRTLRRKQPLLL
jgi:hypothetical protein